MNTKKLFEIAGKKTSEIAKLNLCWEEAQKERDLYFLELLKKEGCNSTRLKYWEDLLSKDTNLTTGGKK